MGRKNAFSHDPVPPSSVADRPSVRLIKRKEGGHGVTKQRRQREKPRSSNHERSGWMEGRRRTRATGSGGAGAAYLSANPNAGLAAQQRP